MKPRKKRQAATTIWSRSPIVSDDPGDFLAVVPATDLVEVVK